MAELLIIAVAALSALVALVAVIVAPFAMISRKLDALSEKRRIKRAAKAALRQKAPPVSRFAPLNHAAGLKAKRY